MTTNGTAPKRLYLLQSGTGTIPVGDQSIAMSAGCYLVQTANGKNILVDTGVPEEFTQRPDAPPITLGPNVVEQLAALGIAPDDVETVICTHFDIDHVGYHAEFPNAEFVVQREHYEQAQGDNPRFVASRPYWDRPELRYRFVEGDTELRPGVRLLATSGHVPGHQSVLIDLPRTGTVLLAIDAVSMARLFTPDRPATPMDDNEEQVQASARKLLDLVEREQVPLVVFHHDGAQWEALKKAPEFYD